MLKKTFFVFTLFGLLWSSVPLQANKVQLFTDCLTARLLHVRDMDQKLFAYVNRPGTIEFCWELYQHCYPVRHARVLQPHNPNYENIASSNPQLASLMRDLHDLGAINAQDLDCKLQNLIQLYIFALIRDDIDDLVDEIKTNLNVDLRTNYLCYDLNDWSQIRTGITNCIYAAMAQSSMKSIRTYFARYLQHLALDRLSCDCQHYDDEEECVDDCAAIIEHIPSVYTYLTRQ